MEIEEWGKESKDCLQAQRGKDGVRSCATGRWSGSLKDTQNPELSTVFPGGM